MTYGKAGRRTKPRVNVLRGYWGNEPQSLTTTAKPKANEAIKSGMVISLDSNGEWVKGCPDNKVPHIAFHDQSDTDVTSSGKLLGFSCAGDFEIETGYFDTNDTFANGDALVAGTSGLAGSVDKGEAFGGEDATEAAVDILGFVTKGKIQVQGGTKTVNSVVYFDPAGNVNSEATLGAVYTLTFITRWMPSRKAVAAA